MKKRIIPIFVPHRGCPHDCIFCNQKKITGVSTDITSEDVKNIVDEYLTTIDKDASVEIAFWRKFYCNRYRYTKKLIICS